ncbi:MAG: ABC transporter ATP-binding protein [Lachnospiraceae bacterium]
MEVDGIVAEGVSKVYKTRKDEEFKALQEINLTLKKGQHLAIEGESGSGKSTLARLLVGLEKPTAGSIKIDNQEITGWNYAEWRKHRKKIQAVFQDASGTLNPLLSVIRNVEEALINLTDLNKKQRRERIYQLMECVKMEKSLLDTPVTQLSGGEQRRLALLRAIAVDPDYIIMDEVTSGLDLVSSDAVLNLVENSARHSNCSCILITHNQATAKRIADHILVMRSGRIVRQGYRMNHK